jgi:hypothetical protein
MYVVLYGYFQTGTVSWRWEGGLLAFPDWVYTGGSWTFAGGNCETPERFESSIEES